MRRRSDELDPEFCSVALLSLPERKTNSADFWLVFGLFIFCSNGAQCSNPLAVVVGHGGAEVTLSTPTKPQKKWNVASARSFTNGG